MKVKRFNNLWAMGLILFGVLLVAFYVAKIFFPQFIVGVAQTPSIVKFGNYVDSNNIYIYLFNGITSFIPMYLFGCACCRVTKLKFVENLFLVILFIVSCLVQEFIPTQSFTFNVCGYFIFVLFICTNRKIKNYKVLYSTIICYLITAFAQSLSLEIRDVSTLISYPNTATYFILLIDLYIWSGLLYLFFNYKGEQNNG